MVGSLLFNQFNWWNLVDYLVSILKEIRLERKEKTKRVGITWKGKRMESPRLWLQSWVHVYKCTCCVLLLWLCCGWMLLYYIFEVICLLGKDRKKSKKAWMAHSPFSTVIRGNISNIILAHKVSIFPLHLFICSFFDFGCKRCNLGHLSLFFSPLSSTFSPRLSLSLCMFHSEVLLHQFFFLVSLFLKAMPKLNRSH